MSSIIEGYNYDIFISYRQKDNKGDRWVSEFVEALKTELESTFKEEISVYFDINPHDGLLETHDVDESLKEKLKCLVFIPIISRTYCDPKSFAWEHEFIAFVEQASKDQFGLKVKLPNGNVASRVIPVKIHDLNPADITMYESLVEGYLRGVDFIYSEPGVNRPLTMKDNEEKNICKTNYRNQVNKLANALSQIVDAFRNRDAQLTTNIGESEYEGSILERKINKKLFKSGLVTISIILALVLYLFIRSDNEKSIALLPFRMLSGESERHIANGLKQSIVTHLSEIKDLQMISATESFLESNKTHRQIGKELGVSYLLDCSFQNDSDNVNLYINVIETRKGSLIWSKEYKRKWSNIMTMGSEVTQNIASALGTKVTQEEKSFIERLPTENIEAYRLLMLARDRTGEEKMKLLDQALALDSGFAEIYAEKAAWWLWSAGGWNGKFDSKEVIAQANRYIKRALEIDPDNAEVHYAYAGLQIWYFWNFEESEKEYKTAISLAPHNAEIIHDYTDLLDATGRFRQALKWSKRGVELAPATHWEMGLRQYFMKQYEKADRTYLTVTETSPNPSRITEEARVKLYMGQYDKVRTLLEGYFKYFPENRAPRPLSTLAIACLKTGGLDSSKLILNELINRAQETTAGSPCYYIAMIFCQMSDYDKSFQWLEKAYENREVEMYWLKVEPPFEPLRKDPRWKILLKKVGFSDV